MELFNQLVRFETDLWNALERRLLHADQVGLATLQALQVLHRHDGQGRVNEVSRELSITIGAASKLVDRLERDGLATRRPHPEDRRSSLVTLTTAGEGARVSAEHIAQPFVSSVLGDGEDAERLSAALRSLRAELDRVLTAVPA